MEVLKYSAVILLAAGFIAVTVFSVKSGKAVKTLLLNAFAGATVLAIINLTAKFTGVYIPLNPYTAVGAVCYGVPAVCGFLVLPIIFGK